MGSTIDNVKAKIQDKNIASCSVIASELLFFVPFKSLYFKVSSRCETKGRLKRCFAADGAQKSTDPQLASWHVPSVDEVIDPTGINLYLLI